MNQETKIALVTGGSDGVGFSIVRALAKENYDVHFVGLNTEKGSRIEQELQSQTNKTVRFWQVNLSDMSAVVQFANAFSEQVPHLDRLVCSAGLASFKRIETAQGFEQTFAVNYLSAYVLSKKLKGLLEKAERARLLLVSGSEAIVLKPQLNFSDLHHAQSYQGIKVAAHAIHAKTVLAQLLSNQWKGNGVTVNTFHPGFVRSSLTRHFPWGVRHVASLATRLLSKDSKLGIAATLSSDFDGVTGCYFDGNKRTLLAFEADYCGQLDQAAVKILKDYL